MKKKIPLKVAYPKLSILFAFSILISACGGGSGDNTPQDTSCIVGTSTVGSCTLN